jgi:hypothetical protein
MDIDVKDIITLSDDRDYGVVGKANYQDKTYYYLVDTINVENVKFFLEDGSELVEIEDKQLIQKLLPLFILSIKDEINEILETQE